jgi:hypothetical protein
MNEYPMEKILKTILKTIFIVSMTFAVFILLKNTIAQVGGMPQSFKDAYHESYFIRTGTFYPAIILLMTVILIHLLWNYVYLNKTIHCLTHFKGTWYGLAFGILWFFGFLELVVIYHSNFFRHVASGVRDLISLTVFGSLAGICFTTKAVNIDRKGESPGVILYSSVLFALFHGVQYSFTFTALEQHVDDLFAVVWLLSTGGWIGIMYYYFSPKIDNIVLKTTFFAVNTFGINWLLYTSFYHLFLEIPAFDLLIRCIFDILGILLGLLLYEYAKRKSTKLRVGA